MSEPCARFEAGIPGVIPIFSGKRSEYSDSLAMLMQLSRLCPSAPLACRIEMQVSAALRSRAECYLEDPYPVSPQCNAAIPVVAPFYYATERRGLDICEMTLVSENRERVENVG